MHVTLLPARGLPGQPETTISVSGDTITVDGTSYDLSSVPEGGEAIPEGDHPFAGTITRSSSIIACAVYVALGDDAEPVQPTELAHWIVESASGAVTIPATRKPKPEDAV